jgi:cell division protein FtsN
MVLLFSGFFYLLTFINGSADTHSPQPKEQIKPVTTVAPKPQSKAKLNDEPLPPPPKEDWTYFEELESKTVEVDLPPPEPSQGPYQMQCASFRSREQAEALKARIAFQGKEAMVREVSGKNGVWFKVVLGPYEKKRTAEKDRHVLSRAGISTCKIWKWQG